MICKHEKFMLTAFWIMLTGFRCFNNGQQLTVMSFVTYFSRNYLSKKKVIGCY